MVPSVKYYTLVSTAMTMMTKFTSNYDVVGDDNDEDTRCRSQMWLTVKVTLCAGRILENYKLHVTW